ncbi:MAG: outer rane receptor protein [Bacteroidota bacterium]|nr:outer rane receptor protein [Bacteroidota bacterium]
MKKVLFFLLIAKISTAQVDSLSMVKDTSKLQLNLNTVNINAVRAGSNSPTPYQVISKEELNKNNLGQDLPYLLNMTPSVVTTSDAGTGIGYTDIHIRGSDNTRINVTLNGIPVNDGESQGVYWVDIPDVVSSTQNIQIQRGVGTSTNGPGAFGGTISVQTQTPNQDPFGQIDVSGGSFNTFKGTAKAGTGLIKNCFFAEGSASWITSNGYVQRAAANLRSYFFQTGYQHKNTLLKFVYFGGREKTYQAWDGVLQDSLKTNRTYNDLGTDYGQHSPPYANQTDNYGQDYFQLLFSQNLPKDLNLNIGLFSTLGRGYYEEYKVAQDLNSYFPGYDTVPVVQDIIRQKWLKNIYYGGTFALNYTHKNIDAAFGGLLSQYRGENFGKVIWADGISNLPDQYYYDGHSVKNDFNVYAKFNYNLLQKINLFADLQYRYVSYQTNGTDDNLSAYSVNKIWNFFNPKVGVLYKVKPAQQIYASFALGNREPNRDDILAATATQQPKAETMRDLEVGYRGVFKESATFRSALNLNYYLMHYKDQLVLTGRLNDVGNPIKANVPVSYRTGIELSGSFSFYKRPREYEIPIGASGLGTAWVVPTGHGREFFRINYTFTYSLNKISAFDESIYTYDPDYVPIDSLTETIHHKNTNISFSPSIIASLELVAYPVKGLSISLLSKAVSKQYLDNTSNDDRMLKAFYYTNINISYTVPLNKAGKEITLKLLLNNIFNHLFESNGYTYTEKYAAPDNNGNLQVSPAYTYNYYSPQAGFNVLAGISVKF